MKNLRGNHTSLIPLAEEISEILISQNKSRKKAIRISPGLIIRKNIKIKQVSIKLKQEESEVILCEVLMKGSKQYLRIYETTIKEIKSLLKNFCETKQILLK